MDGAEGAAAAAAGAYIREPAAQLSPGAAGRAEDARRPPSILPSTHAAQTKPYTTIALGEKRPRGPRRFRRALTVLPGRGDTKTLGPDLRGAARLEKYVPAGDRRAREAGEGGQRRTHSGAGALAPRRAKHARPNEVVSRSEPRIGDPGARGYQRHASGSSEKCRRGGPRSGVLVGRVLSPEAKRPSRRRCAPEKPTSSRAEGWRAVKKDRVVGWATPGDSSVDSRAYIAREIGDRESSKSRPPPRAPVRTSA
jgi:hypothetical protein